MQSYEAQRSNFCYPELMHQWERGYTGKKDDTAEGKIIAMMNKKFWVVQTSPVQSIFRILLGVFLGLAGVGHLSVLRQEFLAQVPNWLPIDGDLVVVLSGVVEILLGVGLIILPSMYRVIIGWATAAFFVLIFPGNISQYVYQMDAFGLNSDLSRLVRLFFQPVLVIWALWSTGAWRAWRQMKSVR